MANRFPSKANLAEWIHIPTGLTHSENCLKLDHCWFVEDNKPALPQHNHCHCTSYPIPFSLVLNKASSECRYSKFDPYLFDPEGVYDNNKGNCLRAGATLSKIRSGCGKRWKDRVLESTSQANILWEY